MTRASRCRIWFQKTSLRYPFTNPGLVVVLYKVDDGEEFRSSKAINKVVNDRQEVFALDGDLVKFLIVNVMSQAPYFFSTNKTTAPYGALDKQIQAFSFDPLR